MSDDRAITLGDMTVLGLPQPTLHKALAIIAETLHPAFDNHPRIAVGKSKESCVLCSLAVRDFLDGIGFDDAEVRPVCAVMRAVEGTRELHSLGLGYPKQARREGYWSGHLVVTAAGWLIDTTLYRAIRPAWPKLTGMVAAPILQDDGTRMWGSPILSALDICDRDYIFGLAWLDTPDNSGWRSGPDARDRQRRLPVIAALKRSFAVTSFPQTEAAP